jgi:hypothetical protein
MEVDARIAHNVREKFILLAFQKKKYDIIPQNFIEEKKAMPLPYIEAAAKKKETEPREATGELLSSMPTDFFADARQDSLPQERDFF